MHSLKLKNGIVFILPLCLSMICCSKVEAIDLERNFVYLNQGKSMFIKASNASYVEWNSSNNSVAEIDSRGFINAKSVGSSTIIAKDKINGDCAYCTINVTKEDPIRFIYCSQNNFKVGENVDIYIITSKNALSVKCDVYNNGNKTELKDFTRTDEGNTIVWRGKLNIKNQNSYKIVPHGLLNGIWTKSQDNFIEIFSCEKDNEQNLRKKMASDKCIDFIASCEGFSHQIYCDKIGGNVYTIGYGHVVKPYKKFFDVISNREAKALLKRDINNGEYSQKLNDFLIKNKIACNQSQFDALLSFTYNLGTRWMYNGKLSNVILNCGSENNKRIIGTVKSSNGLNVRSMPDTESKRMCALKNGVRVNIIDKNKINNQWYKIRLENGSIGYCFAEYMNVSEENEGVKRLSDIDTQEFIKIFSAYHHASGRCYWGLLNRRFYELDMFFYGKYGVNGKFVSKYANIHNYPIPECIKGK